MNVTDVTMKIRPSKTCYITRWIGAIVAEQENSVFEDGQTLVFYSEIVVPTSKVAVLEDLEAFHSVVRQDDTGCLGLEQGQCCFETSH